MQKQLPVVTMNIKREFFAKILARPREKQIEYREMTDYWKSRIEKAGRPPFRLRLINGMRRPLPEATLVVNRLTRNYRTGNFELHLGRVLEVRYWDRAKKCPSRSNRRK